MIEYESISLHFHQGVASSEAMAKRDGRYIQAYKEIIHEVGRELNIEPSLIAAIISRESRGGTALKEGWGDNGNAFGLMQVRITFDEVMQ